MPLVFNFTGFLVYYAIRISSYFLRELFKFWLIERITHILI